MCALVCEGSAPCSKNSGGHCAMGDSGSAPQVRAGSDERPESLLKGGGTIGRFGQKLFAHLVIATIAMVVAVNYLLQRSQLYPGDRDGTLCTRELKLRIRSLALVSHPYPSPAAPKFPRCQAPKYLVCESAGR